MTNCLERSRFSNLCHAHFNDINYPVICFKHYFLLDLLSAASSIFGRGVRTSDQIVGSSWPQVAFEFKLFRGK